jgi:predicted small metal-binding protein
MAAAWYLTKEGRADFAAKAKKRDEERLNNPAVWVGIDEDHDPTMTEACANILMACPGWVDIAKAYSEQEQEKSWRGVDFDHLKAKAKESQIEAEAVDKIYRSVLAEAKRAIRRPYYHPALTMAV